MYGIAACCKQAGGLYHIKITDFAELLSDYIA